MSVIYCVAELVRPQPEPFAVIAVHPDRPCEGGGCEAIFVSFHMKREEADRVVLASASITGTRQ